MTYLICKAILSPNTEKSKCKERIMKEYLEFLNKNYTDTEKINILQLSSGCAGNKILQVGQIKSAAGAEQRDVYMSMNPLTVKNHRINRDKEHVSRLKWLYVDLDYYHSCYRDFSKTQIIGLLEFDYFGKIIPVPTYIVDSGRGLYLLWKINEHIKAYPRWEKMQLYLCNCLKEFGADRKVVSDSARVLRCIGSINSKCGTKVEVLQHQEQTYCLTNLLREYVVDDRPSEKMISYAKSIAKILEIEPPSLDNRENVKKFIRENKEPANLFQKIKSGQKQCKQRKKITHLRTEYSMLCARLSDLEKLLTKYRDEEGGSREHILFLYRYWQLCNTNDKDVSLQLTLQLNSRLKNPLEEKEVREATKSAEKYFDSGKKFRCSNAYVIDALHITSDEMKELSIFIASGERARRKRERNKKAYLQTLKEEGKLTAEEKIRARRKKLAKMLLKGYCVHEICQKLNISRATFYADKKQIERILATKKEIQEKRQEQYNRYRQTLEEKCLKISALVLDMSFRTCALSFLGPVQRLFEQRLWRYWGALQLQLLSVRPFSLLTADNIGSS